MSENLGKVQEENERNFEREVQLRIIKKIEGNITPDIPPFSEDGIVYNYNSDNISEPGNGSNASTEDLVSETTNSVRFAPINRSISTSPEADRYQYFTVVIVGDCGVGKTVFHRRFCYGIFDNNTTATVAGPDLAERIFEVNGRYFGLELCSTAGVERYRNVMSPLYRKTQGAIVMYDITERETFQNILYWVEGLMRNRNTDPVLMLVGSKLDQVEEELRSRAVSSEEAAEFAQKNDMLFFEVSSKTGHNVEDAVREITASIYERRKKITGTLRLKPETNQTRKKCNC